MSRHEEIEKLAYELWAKCGCKTGHDLDHWLEAERQVLDRHRQFEGEFETTLETAEGEIPIVEHQTEESIVTSVNKAR